MSCCCQKIYRGFCAIGTCATDMIDLNMPVQIAGNHTLTFTFLGVDYTITKAFLLGANLSFPSKSLNEDCEVVAQVKDPNGDTFSFITEDVEYDCFVISTKLNYPVS